MLQNILKATSNTVEVDITTLPILKSTIEIATTYTVKEKNTSLPIMNSTTEIGIMIYYHNIIVNSRFA